MTYRGQVKNGVVVFEGMPPLPEGTQVRVEAVQAPSETQTVWDRLLELAGTAESLPPDASQKVQELNSHSPQGTRVHVEAVEETETLGQKLLKHAGRAQDLPTDMARNHDHYLHGRPKK